MLKNRLQRDDFIALRSISTHFWRQGDTIGWKFNRAWRSVRYGEVPALEAAERLVAMGLVEDTICCADCRRAAFKLSPRGAKFVGRMNAKSSFPSIEGEGTVKNLPRKFLSRLRAMLA